jgi:Protein of unknown function (DUF2489)
MNRTNPLDETQSARVRSEVVSTARALGSNAMPFLEGVRRLVELRFEVSHAHHDPDFMLFVGIESEADHIPSAEVRALYAESWLVQCDREAKELEIFYERQVRAACEQLIARFSSAT